MITITETIAIDPGDLEEKFVRAPGPGGQNVNKVATAVQLRFLARGIAALPESVQRRLARLAGRRLTSDGDVMITASQYRTQSRNREDAMARLTALIREAATPPRHRRKTRLSYTKKQNRLDQKKRRSNIKKLRGRPPD